MRVAEPTKIQSLVDITDFDTGEPIDVVQFIRRETRLVIQDRNIMRSRYRAEPANPWLVCTLCGAAVQLVSHMDRRFYFRHMPEEENRGCPVNTKGQYSADEINAMKYNGAKESLAHQRLKEIVRDSIQADPRFDMLLVERVWRGMERKSWRKPDVQATWGDRKFAFEIQLSTTFLSVIVDRRDFYRAENGHLIWIFQSFDPHRTRRAEEDIFYNNNSNVFVVNQQTLQQSRQAQRLMLECWYAVPHRHDGHIEDEWYRKEVFIDDLTFDLPRQRAYFFDYEAARTALEQSSIDEELSDLREAFERFWRTYGGDYDASGRQDWNQLCGMFQEAGLELPENYDSRPFAGVVSMMLSAKYGEPVGYRLQKLIEVTNVAFNAYKHYLYLFGWALKVYGNESIVDAQDNKGTWHKRRDVIRCAMQAKEPEYERLTDFDDLILFLLPELRDRIDGVRNYKLRKGVTTPLDISGNHSGHTPPP